MKKISVIRNNFRSKDKSGSDGNSHDAVDYITKEKLVLAPMAGITDPPFRLLAREYGCRYAFTEMIDINGIYHRNYKTFDMLKTTEDLKYLGVQIVGADMKRILHGAKVCEEKGFHLLDFNAACPARKVVIADKGASLLKDFKRLEDILQMLSSELSIPVTLKIRSGWDNENVNCVGIARLAEKAGVRAISIHPRTQHQAFKGRPDHGLSRLIKKEVGIPVFVSGNIFTPEDAVRVIEETSCDALIVARGVFGYPWIFEDIGKAIKGSGARRPGSGMTTKSFEEIKKIMNRHMALNLQFYDEKRAFSRMYKHVCWYLKRYRGLEDVMKYYRNVKTYVDFVSFLKSLRVDEERRLRVAE